MAQKLTVVFTGATGKQGGAVARELLAQGHKVRAVTRDPNSPQAKSLARAGVAIVRASLEDTAALAKALEGATSLFAVTVRQPKFRGLARWSRWRRDRSHRRGGSHAPVRITATLEC